MLIKHSSNTVYVYNRIYYSFSEKKRISEPEISHNGNQKAIRVAKDLDNFHSIPNSTATIEFGTTHYSVLYLTDVNPSALEPVLLPLDTEGRKRIPS